jgi:UDP-galactopyranose mutase
LIRLRENILKYDYLIVGMGLYGCIVARELNRRGKSVFMIDKRDHIGGNCASENIDGIECHKYGPHVFHTNDYDLIRYLQQFSVFKNFVPHNKILYKEKMYDIPINLRTIEDVLNNGERLNQLEAKELVLEDSQHDIIDNKSIESWCLSNIGEKLYRTCVEGYTWKQWEKHPSELPEEIIKRLPVRYNYESGYFNHKYSVVPKYGWQSFFENLIEYIPYLLKQDFFANREGFLNMAKKVIYTGPIDEFFDYRYGYLNWRSLQFEKKYFDVDEYQGQPIIHYGDLDIQYTRSVEYKYIHGGPEEKTIVIYENSCKNNSDPYYPVNTEDDKKLYNKYKELADLQENVFFGGRLARYQYNDMDQTIENALKDVEKCL